MKTLLLNMFVLFLMTPLFCSALKLAEIKDWQLQHGQAENAVFSDNGKSVKLNPPEVRYMALVAPGFKVGEGISLDAEYAIECEVTVPEQLGGYFSISADCMSASGKRLKQIIFFSTGPKNKPFDWRRIRMSFGKGTSRDIPKDTVEVFFKFAFSSSKPVKLGITEIRNFNVTELKESAKTVDAAWPKEILITAGDLQTRLEKRSFWTIYRIDWKGKRLGVDNFGSHYGSVANFPGTGWIGSGHTENEDEKILSIELSIDGKVVKGVPAGKYSCREAVLVKTSALRDLRIRTETHIFSDRIEETVSLKAEKDTPLNLIYHFMCPMTTDMAQWYGIKSDGKSISGNFTGSGGFIANTPMKWLAFHAPSMNANVLIAITKTP
ncbi:MAG: hypothetical protein JXR78_16425, partial [Victivallales bacterium]|nr:hypothetical protein [Victivallales bacterium]